MAVEIKPATEAEYAAFYGAAPERSTRAFVAMLEGVPIAIAGVYRDTNYLVAFSQMKDEMRPLKKDIVRLARANMAAIAARGEPVIAFANKDEATAPHFLERLGFRHEGSSVHGEVYSWAVR